MGLESWIPCGTCLHVLVTDRGNWVCHAVRHLITLSSFIALNSSHFIIHQWNIRCSLSAVALVEMMRFSSFRSVMFLSETVYGCEGRLLSLSVFFFPILEICFPPLTSCLDCGIVHLYIYEWERKSLGFLQGSLESIVIFSTFWIKFICPFFSVFFVLFGKGLRCVSDCGQVDLKAA